MKFPDLQAMAAVMGQIRIECGVIGDHNGATGDPKWGNPGLPHTNPDLPPWGNLGFCTTNDLCLKEQQYPKLLRLG